MIHTNTAKEKRITEKIFAAGQEQVFRFWNELDPEQRDNLLKQLDEFDFELINTLRQKHLLATSLNSFKGHLEPVNIIPPAFSEKDKKRIESAQRLGEKAIAEGKVAALVVAGGQGTRLGIDGPKGKFPAGPVSKKSLFQLFAEKIRALEQKYNSKIPWYIMTSKQNDTETKAFFEAHNYFGMASKAVTFFQQGVMPALTPVGKLIPDAKDHVFVNPDGHGGTLVALEKSGALKKMQGQGIQWIFYFQVDNVLLKMCDPLFLGYHIQRDAEMSAKVVAKRDPYEKVGVIGQVDGKVKVIEYSDLSPEEMEARNPDGRLKYNGGNIAIHILNVNFVEKLIKSSIKLPFHKAFKKIPTLDENGNSIMPDEPNGYKFEIFVFDALQAAREVVVMEVKREEEFSPIKNGTGFDSPETARQDMSNYFGRLLEKYGLIVPKDQNGNVTINIEISPLLALEAEDLEGKLPANLDLKNNLYLE